MRFCEAMLDFAREPLPGPASRAARRTLLNVMGTAVSAADAPATSIIAGQAKGEPYWAALATGTAAHLDDFDDTHLATVIHPGASTLATVLALAQSGTAQSGTVQSGAALLGAFAAGCEAQLRIGNAISPAHYDHGWHITGTCGVFGAGIAAAALLGLTAAQACAAMSLAAVMTLGHREAFGSMTKPLHAGKAAANGILAAWLAGRRGLAGPGDPLGPGGALDVLAGGAPNVDWPALGRGGQLELNTFKTYPCGVVAHPAMDAAVDAFPLVQAAAPEGSAAITAVAVTGNPLVLELMGLRHPEDGLQSRFSARHGIAAGLRYGRAGLAEFSDQAAADPEMARLRDLIELNPEPSCARDAAVLRVSLRDGGLVVEVHVEHTRGSAARPLSDAELQAKVSSLADPVLGAGAGTRIRDVVDALPAAANGEDLLAAIRPAGLAPVRPAPAGPVPATPAGPAGSVASPVPDATASVADAVPVTDVILALALGPAALADALVVADQAASQAKRSLAAFAAAVESGEGTTVERAVAAARDAGTLPAGHSLTAFASAAAAVAGALDTETAIVCAAASALGENCAEPVAIGLDVAGLVAAGLPSAASRGWSVPVISAAVGATVAAGLMLGLPEPRLRAAIGIAATQATGLAAAEGTDAGPLQAGKAAFNAVEAAQLARAGFTSSARPLEGRRGLYALFGG